MLHNSKMETGKCCTLQREMLCALIAFEDREQFSEWFRTVPMASKHKIPVQEGHKITFNNEHGISLTVLTERECFLWNKIVIEFSHDARII